jgi:hypothetical protein
MGKKVQIICARPGMRRHGVEHPATATYDLDRWTEEQLAAFREDPSFHVNEIDDAGVVTKGDEFDKAVAEAVDVRVQAIADQMNAKFNAAVADAAAEKIAAAEAKVKALEAKIAELQAKAKPPKT